MENKKRIGFRYLGDNAEDLASHLDSGDICIGDYVIINGHKYSVCDYYTPEERIERIRREKGEDIEHVILTPDTWKKFS